MKIFHQIALTTSIALGLGALAYLQASPQHQAKPASYTVERSASSAPLSELANPLLHKEFTSSCLSARSDSYRETLRFAADATITFARHYFADALCQVPHQKENVREGRFSVAAEEAGQLLLIVRNLQDEKAVDVTPYFEALIKVDREQLVMQSSLGTALHYEASIPSI